MSRTFVLFLLSFTAFLWLAISSWAQQPTQEQQQQTQEQQKQTQQQYTEQHQLSQDNQMQQQIAQQQLNQLNRKELNQLDQQQLEQLSTGHNYLFDDEYYSDRDTYYYGRRGLESRRAAYYYN